MEKVSTDTLLLTQQIAGLTEDLFFDDWGSESSTHIQSFYLEADLKELNTDTFAELLSLDKNSPADQITEFASAGETLTNFINNHQAFGLEAQAYQLVDLMSSNLKDLSIVILGEAGHPDLSADHHVFVVGIGPDGDVAGFRSTVCWS